MNERFLRKEREVRKRALKIVLSIVIGFIISMIALPTLILNIEYRMPIIFGKKPIEYDSAFDTKYAKSIGDVWEHYGINEYEYEIHKFFEETGVQVYFLDINLGKDLLTQSEVDEIVNSQISEFSNDNHIVFVDAMFDYSARLDYETGYHSLEYNRKIIFSDSVNTWLGAKGKRTVLQAYEKEDDSPYGYAYGATAFAKSLSTSADYLMNPIKIIVHKILVGLGVAAIIYIAVMIVKRSRKKREAEFVLESSIKELVEDNLRDDTSRRY